MKELAVLTENKPGVLAKVSGILGKNGVNIESISVESFAENAIIRFITNDYITAKKLLEENNYNVMETDILLIELLDRPGELSKISQMLANEEINIEGVYLLSKNAGRATVAFKVDKPSKARVQLKKYLAKT